MNIQYFKPYDEKSIRPNFIKIIGCIQFDPNIKDDNSIKAFKEINDWLEETFIMFQYKTHDNYYYHQLFYFTDKRWLGSFEIRYNELYLNEWNAWTEKILNYIIDNYSEIYGNVNLVYLIR